VAFGRIGMWELLLILAIALIIFGPKKLPEMGKALGETLQQFKSATKKLREDIEDDGSAEDSKSTD